MTLLLRSCIQAVRPLLVAVLAYMVLAVSSAHVRETVMVKLQETGTQRFYETEAGHHGTAEVRLARLKIGRKPVEARPLRLAVVRWPAQPPSARPPHGPASPRAPPHQPRAPPFA